MERPVVVANPRVIATERHSQMIVVIVVKQHAFQVDAKCLSLSFSKRNFRQHTGLVVNSGGKQQIEIAGVEVSVRAGHKTVSSQFGRSLIQDFVVKFSESSPLNAVEFMQFLQDGSRLRIVV